LGWLNDEDLELLGRLGLDLADDSHVDVEAPPPGA
jgi:hypothetical protein